MKHLQKSLALFLCVVLCLSFFPFSASYAEEADCEGVASNQDEIPILEEIDTTGEAQSKDDSLVTEEDDSVSETVLVEESFLDAALDIEGAFTEASAATIVASGTCGAQGDNLTWTLDNKGTLTISGTGAMQDYYWTGTTPPTRPWEDYWHSIRELVVNDGVTALGEYAFEKMFELQRVVLPEGITCLPRDVFCNCQSLSDINFPSSLTTLEDECLFSTGIDTLLLPATVTTVEGHFYGGPWGAESKRFETPLDHPVFSAIDGVLFTKDLSTLVLYPCCDQTTYTVPDGTVEIREHAFALNDTLEKLRVPATVALIGEGAFYHCTGLQTAGPLDGDYNIRFGWTDSIPDYAFDGCTGLTSITIPNSVTSIGDFAFRDCTSLTSITIPNSVTSIGDDAFWRCTGLTSITIPNSVTSVGEYAFFYCTGLTSIRIPNSVSSIRDGTFGCTGLMSITIPNSVTSIGDIAFWDSTGLTDVYYSGTQEQWKQIDIGYDNELLTSATIHYSIEPDLYELVLDNDGVYRVYEDGVFQPISGFIQYGGGLFYVTDGILDSSANGLKNNPDDPAVWYFCANGQVQQQYSGLAEYEGEWFYLSNGVLDTTSVGIVSYDGGRFMIAAGRILREVDGMIQDPNTGLWYYVAAGQVADYTGLAQYDGAWFYITDGMLAVDYTGWVKYNGSDFYVVNGMVTDSPKNNVVELNWNDFEDALRENELEGDFYVLNAVTAQFWVPSFFLQAELTDEDTENGLIAYFDDGSEGSDYGFFVTYFDLEGATLEEFAEEIAKNEAYYDLELLKINGLDAIGFTEDDEDLGVIFEYVSFVTDDGYLLTFTYWDFADEDYQALAVIMIASIQPE